MIELSNMPLLPGETSGRKVSQVTAEEIKGVGVSGSAFAMHVGDVINFDTKYETSEGMPMVIAQKTSTAADAATAYYVACERNGKNSWIGVGTLTRRDVTGAPCHSVAADAVNFANFVDFYQSKLRGKKITAKSAETKKFAKFVNGIRQENESVERSVAQIEYVA